MSAPTRVVQYRDMVNAAVVALEGGRFLELYVDVDRLHLVVREPAPNAPRRVVYAQPLTLNAARAIAAALVVATGGGS